MYRGLFALLLSENTKIVIKQFKRPLEIKKMSEKLMLRTPVTYYGGKQNMVKYILPLIPPHNLYCEPFCGGAAIFFAKENANVNVLNDTNRELINFYQIVKSDFVSLEKEIQITLHSRDLHRKASVIYNNPDMFSDIKRAWALWMLSSQSFCAKLDGSWGYDICENRTSKHVTNKKESFTLDLAIKLQDVQVECADALYIIRSRDRENSFFYVDPPYYNSDMGHYDGYSIDDFEKLLVLLSEIKGKFLLSSYPSEILTKYTKTYKWQTWSVDQKVSVNAKSGYQKRKVEVLTANYNI
jgi:DNA adenine methylase